MPNRKLTVLSLSLFFAMGMIGLQASAQSLTGEWKGSLVKDKSKVNLNFALRRETDGEKKWNHTIGHTFEFSQLGLTREQVVNGGPVNFSLWLSRPLPQPTEQHIVRRDDPGCDR